MRPPRPARLLLVIMATGAFPCPAQPLTDMELQRHADSTDLLVRFRGPVHEPLRVRVQRSSDLRSWENIGAVFHFEPDDRQSMTLQSPDAGPQGFYRAFVRPEPELLATEPEDVLGYAGEFEDALAAVGDMTLPEFAARFDTAVEFLPEVTWDVTTAEYYDEFTRPPDPPVKWNGYGVPIPLPDYSLAPRETEFFQRNGFVVSERLATNSFARVYHGIYLRDLPVLVTSDSILHAWHRSYDTMLSQFEEAYLYDTLQRLLDGLAAEVPEAWADYGTGPLGESIRDADYFVAVARSLLSDAQEHTTTGHDVLVAQTLAAIEAGDMIYFNLFGRMASNPENPRNIVDFSLFKVRGHYVDSPRLQRYFQAVTWCGHIDLRVAGNPEEASPRELGTALVLHDLAQRAGVLARWRDIDTVIRTFVGPPDSMDLDQLARFLEAEGIESPGEIATLADLESLQERLGDTSLGRQLINAHSYAPMAGDQMRLPRSFTLLGQRFVPDSWVTSTVVYDRVPRREDLMARRIPSGIDVAFSVLANDQTVPWLVDRMSRDDGLMFRDGIEYQTNLAALRMVFDGVRDEGWNGSLYTGWLQALRILSAPTTGAPFPEAMRTHAWAMKTLNTQLASWTQLRHDTVGYVKQSATTPGFCSYPYGFVEPLPDFYGQLEALATGARTAFSALSMSGTADIPPSDAINFAAYVSLPKFKANMVSFLGRFATTMATLRGIASKELTQQPLNEEETQFLRDIVQIDTTYYGNLIFDGWYPGLFYRSNEGMDPRWTWAMGGSESRPVHDADLDDRLVADVHTDTPDDICGDPGSVLHEGIGPVYLLLMAVDNGPDRMTCAGPVFSHFEFLTPNAVRLTDAEWKGQLNAGLRPLHPTWTQEYLVPENSPTCGQPAGNGQPSPEPQDCQVSPAAMQSDP